MFDIRADVDSGGYLSASSIAHRGARSLGICV